VSATMLWGGPADVQRWRRLAEEIRTYTHNTCHVRSARVALERIAQDCERLADEAEKRFAASTAALY
jgi:hypothetical protein